MHTVCCAKAIRFLLLVALVGSSLNLFDSSAGLIGGACVVGGPSVERSNVDAPPNLGKFYKLHMASHGSCLFFKFETSALNALSCKPLSRQPMPILIMLDLGFAQLGLEQWPHHGCHAGAEVTVVAGR